MNLLDSFNIDDPVTMGLLSAGTGMMNASGPSLMPHSFGQALNAGLGSYQASKKALLDQQKEKMQLDMLTQQIAQATRKNTLINNMLQNYSGQGSDGVAGTDGASSAGSPGSANTGASQVGVPRDAIAADLAFNEGKNIGEWTFKRNTPNIQVHNGVALDLNRTPAGFTMPTVAQNGQASQLIKDPSAPGGFKVIAPEGAVDTYGAYKTAEKKAENNNTLLPLGYIDSGSGRPIGGTVGTYLDGQQPVSSPAPTQGGSTPSLPAPLTGPAAPSGPVTEGNIKSFAGLGKNGYAGADQNPQLSSSDIAELDAAIAKAPNPTTKAALMELRNSAPQTTNTQSAPPPGAVGPMPPEMEQHLDTVKSLPPNQQATAVQKIADAINNAPNMTAQQKQSMLGQIGQRLGVAAPATTTQPTSQVAVTTQPTGRPQLQSAAEAEAAKLEAAAKVRAATEPNLAYQTDANKNAAKYEESLNGRVATGQDLMMRLDESRNALKQFQSGAGMETRAQLAKMAQAIGAPDGVVNVLAGGNLAALQEFQKLSAQQAMETLKQSMGGSGRITQAEFKVFQENNPNITTDPNATEKIYNFATKVYQRDKSEQDALNHYKSIPGADMSRFNNWWTNRAEQTGIVNPQQVTGQAKGSTQQPTQNFLPQLPTANKSNSGKMAIDHDSGKKYRSNGIQWVEVQ